ncbi:MAG: hypothetical protein RugAbin2_02418 [Rugosibacter sp.]|nr:hypothetical protein [Rugosibacter sp.]
MAKIKFSTGECDRCSEQIVWRSAESGSLSYTCQHCDFRGYAPAHTDAAKKIMAKLQPPASQCAPKIKPLPPEAPPAPPKDAPKKSNSIWDDLTKQKVAE